MHQAGGAGHQSDGTRPNQVLQPALRLQLRQMSVQRRGRPITTFWIKNSAGRMKL